LRYLFGVGLNKALQNSSGFELRPSGIAIILGIAVLVSCSFGLYKKFVSEQKQLEPK